MREHQHTVCSPRESSECSVAAERRGACLAQDGLIQDAKPRLNGIPLGLSVAISPCAQNLEAQILRIPAHMSDIIWAITVLLISISTPSVQQLPPNAVRMHRFKTLCQCPVHCLALPAGHLILSQWCKARSSHRLTSWHKMRGLSSHLKTTSTSSARPCCQAEYVGR